MKNDLLKLVRWFCLKLTCNDLALVAPALQTRLAGGRKDLDLKPDEERPPDRRQRHQCGSRRVSSNISKTKRSIHDPWVELLLQAA